LFENGSASSAQGDSGNDGEHAANDHDYEQQHHLPSDQVSERRRIQSTRPFISDRSQTLQRKNIAKKNLFNFFRRQITPSRKLII